MKAINSLLILVVLLSFVACKSNMKNVDADLPSLTDPIHFQKLFTEFPKDKKILIDVRTPEEHQEGHIANSINIDFYSDDFKKKISQLDTTKTIFLYCKRGGRSASAHKAMRDVGISRICELEGGITAWQKNELTVVE